MSVDGDLLVVGSPWDDDLGSKSGSAYVFERSMGGWVEVAKLLAPDGAPDDRFGNPVALLGNIACIGAPDDDDLGGSSGSAYVFERDPVLGWLFLDKLTASNGSSSDHFGTSIAVRGTDLLVGSESGAAYFFTRSGSTWTEQQRITPLDLAGGFGLSVAAASGRIVIGAPADNGGSAYVFELSGQTWVQAQKLHASDTSGGDRFGVDVAVSGGTVVVGASLHDSPMEPDQGAAYVFHSSGGTWAQTATLTATDGDADDRFGGRVAVDGTDVSVGAANASSGGAAYMYDSSQVCADCNDNLVDDSLDISNGTSQDCNQNTVPDECDIGSGFSFDCNSDGVPDDCALTDCNMNGIPDDCDISAGTSRDCQGDGVPDECEVGFGAVYCYCDAGAPCGNSDDSAGCANATGEGAAVISCGSPSVSADDLFLAAEGVLPNVSGLFFMGGGGGNQQPFGDGERCVFSSAGQAIKRYRPSNGGSSATITLGPVVGIAEMRFGPGTIVPGQTWYFQCWYRDPIGPCGAGYNLSNAISITFAP